MSNADLARLVSELADLTALAGTDPYRVPALRRAASAIGRFHHPLAELIESGADLAPVPGIGRRLAAFLSDLVVHGRSPVLEDRRARTPPGLLAVMRIDGVGPTRARALRDAGIDSPEKLRSAIASRRIHQVEGFGPGTVARLRRGLRAQMELAGGALLPAADRALAALSQALDGAGIAFRAAGDVVRRTEIVSTVDVACGAEGTALRECAQTVAGADLSGEDRANPVELSVGGVRARMMAAPADALDAVAHYLTGPPAYIEALAARAHRRGLDLSPPGPDPHALYARLGLPFIPPELRENAATLARAESGVPSLIALDDITGDLHMHTTWSDGAASVRRMTEAAAERGYHYIAITDHSPSTRIVAGLDEPALRAQAREIDRVQADIPEVRILKGCEVDIHPDGSLDLPDDVLARLDFVIASVHSSFAMTEARMTDRVIRALENPFTHMLAHPTGRKVGRRPGYPLDVRAVVEAAAALGVAIEVNGGPRRLDLDHRGLRLCGELGARVAITSDAHGADRLDNIRYGLDQARRGWLQAHQIVNAGTLQQVLEWTRERRGGVRG